MVVINIKELLEIFKKEKQKIDKYSAEKIQEQYLEITESDNFKDTNYQKTFDLLYNFYKSYTFDLDIKNTVEKILKKKKIKLDLYNKTIGSDQEYIKYYKYKPIKSLGAGAYGKVFLVKKNNKKYACKIQTIPVFEKGNVFKKYIDNWLYEFKLGTKVGKEKVGPKMHRIHFIYDNISNKIYNIIIMEHVDGITLMDYVKTNKLNSEQLKLLDTTIDKLHKLGVIHGDLHTNNIMVINNKKKIRFCIIDYGYATNKKNIFNKQKDINKILIKYLQMNNKYDPTILIVITQLLNEEKIKLVI
jgi:serine/threonine protein kinase